MPSYQVSGDILFAFVVEVEADSEEEAIDQVERGEVEIADYDTSCPGFRVDWAERMTPESPLETLVRGATKDDDA